MIDKMKAESEPLLKADSDLLVGREDRRTGLGVDALKRALFDKLVAPMIARFMATDRAFAKARRNQS